MNQKEINAWRKAIENFSVKYDCFSTGDDSESYFSRSGCDCCPSGLAGDVLDVTCLTQENIKNKNFDEVEEIQLCGECLSALVNGDFSFLDYYLEGGEK